MQLPETVPIAHEPDYRTDTIGHYRDGQFLAGVIYGAPGAFIDGAGWGTRSKRVYVVLHRFDFDGHHLGSDIHRTGTWDEQQTLRCTTASPLNLAYDQLAKLLGSLPDREYRDIEIRPFQLIVDDVLFGLVAIPADDGPDIHRLELYPEELAFTEPWDGSYDT